jgi:hypothetical protein
MASAGKSQLLSFMDGLILTIQTALCDRYVSSLCDLPNDQVQFLFECEIHSYFFHLQACLRFVNLRA